jgi:hypothetical protein
MKALTCESARRRLQGFHDGELATSDQIAVAAHLDWCDTCAAVLEDLRLIGSILRASTIETVAHAPVTDDERAALRRTVVSRMKAERTFSFASRLRGMFDDMHLVYAGLGSACAMLLCVVSSVSMMRFATVKSPGSNANPVPIDARVLLPRSLDGAFATLVPASDSVFMISAVVTREGTVSNPELLHATNGEPIAPGTAEAKAAESLMENVSRARFEPARVDGQAVAVNMVWLVENTTVRADSPIRTSTGHRSGASKKPVAIRIPALARVLPV